MSPQSEPELYGMRVSVDPSVPKGVVLMSDGKRVLAVRCADGRIYRIEDISFVTDSWQVAHSSEAVSP